MRQPENHPEDNNPIITLPDGTKWVQHDTWPDAIPVKTHMNPIQKKPKTRRTDKPKTKK